jgi:hypothetical protein
VRRRTPLSAATSAPARAVRQGFRISAFPLSRFLLFGIMSKITGRRPVRHSFSDGGSLGEGGPVRRRPNSHIIYYACNARSNIFSTFSPLAF